MRRRVDTRRSSAEDIRHWFRFVDWLLDLPGELEFQVRQELARFTQEKRMPLIGGVERIIIEEGRQKGLEEGRKEGQREGLLKGIEVVLEMKFGADGLQLLPEVARLTDLGVLQAVLESLKAATSLDDVRRLIPAGGGQPPA